MDMYKVRDLASLQDGDGVVGVCGKLSNASGHKPFDNKGVPSSRQQATLTDETGSITVVFWGHPNVRSLEGQDLVFLTDLKHKVDGAIKKATSVREPVEPIINVPLKAVITKKEVTGEKVSNPNLSKKFWLEQGETEPIEITGEEVQAKVNNGEKVLVSLVDSGHDWQAPEKYGFIRIGYNTPPEGSQPPPPAQQQNQQPQGQPPAQNQQQAVPPQQQVGPDCDPNTGEPNTYTQAQHPQHPQATPPANQAPPPAYSTDPNMNARGETAPPQTQAQAPQSEKPKGVQIEPASKKQLLALANLRILTMQMTQYIVDTHNSREGSFELTPDHIQAIDSGLWIAADKMRLAKNIQASTVEF